MVIPAEVELATVLFGNVLDGDEGFEGGEDFGGGEDEDLGDGDGIEPALDPAPDSGEEARSTNDLCVEKRKVRELVPNHPHCIGRCNRKLGREKKKKKHLQKYDPRSRDNAP